MEIDEFLKDDELSSLKFVKECKPVLDRRGRVKAYAISFKYKQYE